MRRARKVNNATIRIVFSGLFALSSLVGAILLRLSGEAVDEWLVAVIVGSMTYMFGHVQANGITGKKNGDSRG